VYSHAVFQPDNLAPPAAIEVHEKDSIPDSGVCDAHEKAVVCHGLSRRPIVDLDRIIISVLDMARAHYCRSRSIRRSIDIIGQDV